MRHARPTAPIEDAVPRRPGNACRAVIAGAAAALAAIAAWRALGRRRPDPHAAHQPGPGYAPLDTPKPVAPDLFVVDSLLQGPIGQVVAARMTVIRLPDGGLVLHSPTRLTPALRDALEALGPIRHLVAPNSVHWMFVPEWQAVLPDCVTWAAPGLRRRGPVRRSGLRIDHELTPDGPVAWRGAISLVEVPGGFGFREMALFHLASRTLVLTDLVISLEAARLPPALRPVLRPLLRLSGTLAPDGMPPPYVRALFRRNLWDARLAAERLLALRPDRVVFAHGAWFESDGTARLERSLRWLIE